MKIRCIQWLALGAIALFSAASYAGGAGCDSMEGHAKHKMSVQAEQEFKDHHAWLFSDKSDAKVVVPDHEMTEKSAPPEQPAKDGTVEI